MRNRIIKNGSVFISGFFLMLSFTFYSNWCYEDGVISSIASYVKKNSKKNDPQSVILTALNTTHYLEDRQTEVLGDIPYQSLERTTVIPVSFEALDYGGGACGSYTLFLARILKKLGYKTRIVEMRVNKIWSGHISLAVENNGKLLLLDPLYNIAFKDSSGQLSDINEVAGNWSYYSNHLPASYNREYNYQSGWRFTNWDKYGFLSNSIYSIGAFLWGRKKMDDLSIRYYLLGRNKYYSILSFLGFLLFLIVPCWKSFPVHKSVLITLLRKRPSVRRA